MEDSIKDLTDAIRQLILALNNSSWVVDYLIPILSVFLAASATLLGSYWLKKREFRSLDSIDRKNNIYLPLITIMFKLLDSNAGKPIPIILERESKYINDSEALDIRELNKFVERPMIYNIPGEILQLLYLLESEIILYMRLFDKVIEKSYEIIKNYFDEGLKELQGLNDKYILIGKLANNVDEIMSNRLRLFYNYIKEGNGFLNLYSNFKLERNEIFKWSIEDLNKLRDKENLNELIKEIRETRTVEPKKKYTAYMAIDTFKKMDVRIYEKINSLILENKLYYKYDDICNVKDLASILEGKILKIKKHHIQ